MRDMWEVDGKVYYQDDGTPASEADEAAFREKHRKANLICSANE